MERRDLLRSGAVVATMAVAGCSESGNGGNGGNGGNADDETDASENATDDESTDESTEEGNETTDDETDESDDAGDGGTNESNDTAGNETNESDGTMDDEENETDDASANDTTDEEENESDDTDGNETGGDGELLSDTVETADSYAFETEGGEGAESVVTSGRVDGENMYVTIEETGGTFEIYIIDGETYFVEDEQCMTLPGTAEEEFDQGAVEDPGAEAESQPDVEASGRDTIDGEEVRVFELSGDEAAEYDEDVTYYVSVETGYVRRIETSESVTDFHSWGDVEPVEAPEMECMDMGDFNESDVPM